MSQYDDNPLLLGRPIKQDLTKMSDFELDNLLTWVDMCLRLTSELDSMIDSNKEYRAMKEQVITEIERRYLLS